MEFKRTILLRNGRECCLRTGTEQDAQAALDHYNLTHRQTDFLLAGPGEHSLTVEQEAQLLREKARSCNEILILALVDDKVVGMAGLHCVAPRQKVRHRAGFGVSVERDYWGLGIGSALTKSCIACANLAGYAQLELDVVAENQRAVSLYRNLGFVEYGRNPRGFRSLCGRWQELVLMRLELN